MTEWQKAFDQFNQQQAAKFLDLARQFGLPIREKPMSAIAPTCDTCRGPLVAECDGQISCPLCYVMASVAAIKKVAADQLCKVFTQADLDAAVLAERERCAQVVEECGRMQIADPAELKEVAAAIRGQTKE